MKKWHMESIVNFSARQKLALPNSSQLAVGTVSQLREEEKEFFLIPFLRKVIGAILSYF